MADINAKLIAQFNKLSTLQTNTSKKAGLEVLKRASQERTPVDTGFLRDNQEVIEDGEDVYLEISAPYAALVEFGTSKMEAQPYIRPAIDESQKEITRVVGLEIENQIKILLQRR